MSRGDYTIAARFQTRRGGSLFCETTAGERWVPDGKSLFVRNGRLVFDIGWVGAVESERRVDDGQWHEAVLTYERATAPGSPLHRRPAGRGGETGIPTALSPTASPGSASRPPTFPEPVSYFHGRIAEIRLYKQALDPDEVAKVMTADANDVRLAGPLEA